jgi:hypothetical protein
MPFRSNARAMALPEGTQITLAPLPTGKHAILQGSLRRQCDCLIHHSPGGSENSDDGRRPRAYRSAPLFALGEGLHRRSVLFQPICCFLFMRLAMISLTERSTKAVETGSSFRRRAA